MLTANPPMEHDWRKVRRCGDGAVLARVPSSGATGRQLPDTLFTFRCGDPQYACWKSKLEYCGRGQSGH